MSCLFPKADGTTAYWANILGAVDAIGDVPPSHWRPDDYYSADRSAADRTYARRGGFLDPIEFNPLKYGINPNSIEATDTTQLLGLVVAERALRDAGYAIDRQDAGRPLERERTSCILGVTGALELVVSLGARLGHPHWRRALLESGVDAQTAEQVVARIAEAYVPWQENSFPGLLGNVAAGRIANRFDLGGTNCVVDAACASSLSAIHMASMELELHRADVVIAGGFDTFNDIFMYMCFSKTPALSPSGDGRPLSIDADGTMLGEGLGVVVLKRLDDARRAGDRVYALIKGFGSSSDGRGNAIYAPSAKGQIKSLRAAYEAARVSPATVELVEAHGTGTKVGDAVEIEALNHVFREARPEGTWCAVGSVKSMIGHTKAAAGVAGLMKAALALHHKVLPPTIKVAKPLAALEAGTAPVYVNTECRPWLPRDEHPRRAAVSAFGFGGSNFHGVLEEASPTRSGVFWDGDVQIAPLAGHSIESLRQQLALWDHDLAWPEVRRLAARHRRQFSREAVHRLVLVLQRQADDRSDVVRRAKGLLEHPATSSSSPSGNAYLGTGSVDGKLAVLFPGQGAQRPGMLCDLACRFPVMLEALSEADRAFGETAHGRRLSDLVYPAAVFDDEARRQSEARLRDTRIAQPALGAVSLGAWRILGEFGLRADAMAGHSFGELVALCAAGCFDSATLGRLAVERGRLMSAASGDDCGTMLAVAATIQEAREIVAAEKLSVQIANHNAPRQVVLSGATREIERAAEVFERHDVSVRRLAVSAAFHSPLVAGARDRFATVLETTAWQEGRVETFSNTTGGPYPRDTTEARRRLADQLSRPVRFVDEIENLYAAGVRTFVELGPGTILSGLVRQILGARFHATISLDASRGSRPGQYDLAIMLAQLGALGYSLDWLKWDEDFEPEADAADQAKKRPVLTIPLTGANYVKPREKRAPVAKPNAEPQRGEVSLSPTDARPVEAARQGDAVEREPRNHGAEMQSPQRHAGPEASTDRPGLQAEKSPLSAAPPRAMSFEPPAAPPPDPRLSEALRATQQTMLAFQQMQQQTAALHRQYLEGQAAAQQTLAALFEQQQRLLGASLGFPPPANLTTPHETVTHDATEIPNRLATSPAQEERADASNRGVPVVSATNQSVAIRPEPASESATIPRTVVPDESVPASLPSSKPSPHAASAEATLRVLLEVVAQKTGYPLEVLDPEMGLDADLGIDSIKRVEIFSELQNRLPDAPKAKAEDLGAPATLRQIADFLGDATSGETPASPAVQTGSGSSLLLEVVAEKTGYPTEMLDLEMSLDADLGIDSIKRVEIFSELQQRLPDTRSFRSDELSSLQTLRDVAQWLDGSDEPAAANRASSEASPASATLADGSPATVLLEVVAEKTGYPVEMLDLDMNLDSELGIDSIKRVEIFSELQERLPDAPKVESDQLGVLETLRQVVEYLAPQTGVSASGEQRAPLADSSPSREEAELGVPSNHEKIEANHERVEVMGQSSGDDPPCTETEVALERYTLRCIALPGEDRRRELTFDESNVVWVTDDETGLSERMVASLRERGVAAKVVREIPAESQPSLAALVVVSPPAPAIDFLDQALAWLQYAGPLLDQACQRGGALLAAVSRLGGTFGLGREEPHEHHAAVSGGLAGMVKTAAREWPRLACKAIDAPSEAIDVDQVAGQMVDELLRVGPVEVGITTDGPVAPQLMAETCGASDEAPLGAGDLVVISGGARGVTAETAVALAEAWQPSFLLIGRSEPPAEEPDWLVGVLGEAAIKKAVARHGEARTPKEIQRQFRQTVACRQIRDTLRRIEATGSRVIYRATDVRDAKAVRRAVHEARERFGPVRGLVHGAGVLADHPIERLAADEFSRVVGTKVDGLEHLLAAVADDDLRVLALFSSSTARFGRIGQAAYAAANEVLNKIARREARRRPTCRVKSINWGPWDGGMVSAALKKQFADEGIGVIPLPVGARHLVHELADDGSAIEVVVLGPSPGLVPFTAPSIRHRDEPREPRSKPLKMSPAFERTITVDAYPILQSHVMNQLAVLPMALIVEWFAHAALHDNFGLRFHGFDDLRIYKGVTVDADESATVSVWVGRPTTKDGFEKVDVELRSGSTLHAGGRIVLAEQLPLAPEFRPPPDFTTKNDLGGHPYDGNRLFHGPDLHSIEHVITFNKQGSIEATVRTAPAPGTWLRRPLRSTWLADPLALDASFQLMVLWCSYYAGGPSLPTRAEGYRQYRAAFPAEGVRVIVDVLEHAEHSATARIDFVDGEENLVARIERYHAVVDAALTKAFARNQLFEGVRG